MDSSTDLPIEQRRVHDYIGSFDDAKSESLNIMTQLGIETKDALLKFCAVFAAQKHLKIPRVVKRKKTCIYKFLQDNLEELKKFKENIVVEIMKQDSPPTFYGDYAESVQNHEIKIMENMYLGTDKKFDIENGILNPNDENETQIII